MAQPLCPPQRVQELLDSLDVAALVVSTWESIGYFTGYWGFSHRLLSGVQSYAVIWRQDIARPCLVVPMSDLDMVAQAGITEAEVVPFGNFYVEPGEGSLPEEMSRFRQLVIRSQPNASPLEALERCLRRLGRGHRIALEEASIPQDIWAKLSSLAGLRWVPASHQVKALRMIKGLEEIRRLQEATRLAERAIARCLQEARPGITELEMAGIYRQELIAGGAELTFAVVAFGLRTALPNAIPSDKALSRGDLIRFDVGCRFQGYHADISRTAFFGDPPAEVTAYFKAIEAGLEAALATMKPGVQANAVFQAAVEATRKSGIPHYKRHHVGHGIGLEIYEPPLLAPQVATHLEEGMVFEVETPYYEVGLGGLQIEDTVLVTSSGCERFNRQPAKLILLEA